MFTNDRNEPYHMPIKRSNSLITEPKWKSYVVTTLGPVFTPEQCALIIKEGQSFQPQTAQVGGGQGGKIDPKTRITTLSWIPYEHEATKPMYETIEREGKKANRNHFGFDEVQLNEQAQFTEYSGEVKGHYTWHMDSDIEMKNEPPVRKLTMVTLLSDPNSYEGGELEAVSPGKEVKLKQGHSLFFASFLNHRVKPVTRGVRHSLVVWFGGKPFR